MTIAKVNEWLHKQVKVTFKDGLTYEGFLEKGAICYGANTWITKGYHINKLGFKASHIKKIEEM